MNVHTQTHMLPNMLNVSQCYTKKINGKPGVGGVSKALLSNLKSKTRELSSEGKDSDQLRTNCPKDIRMHCRNPGMCFRNPAPRYAIWILSNNRRVLHVHSWSTHRCIWREDCILLEMLWVNSHWTQTTSQFSLNGSTTFYVISVLVLRSSLYVGINC